ncbi:hypothetical protein F0U62_49320 [Cystobacter fuscus]|uniref:hypothetical protein n=1 Tax=Cystobacter fuscus TaxID=43 RepID=UPI002B2CA3B4|nr:hypothetical protein F0U62_49320 [Cystobacter fuscus]
MRRHSMRWLSVVGALCGAWSPVAMAEGPPVDCGGVEGEAIREMRALYEAEQSLLQEKDKYSQDLAQVGFLPLTCSDGTRPSGPDSSWVGGCRFIYQVEVTGPFSFIATARAVSGLVAGMTLRIDETGTLTRTPAPSGECP